MVSDTLISHFLDVSDNLIPSSLDTASRASSASLDQCVAAQLFTQDQEANAWHAAPSFPATSVISGVLVNVGRVDGR